MFIDTHCHLDWESYQGDLDHVVARANQDGVMKFVTIGVDVPGNRKAAEIAALYPQVYQCVGFHPEIVSEEEFSEGKITVLIKELEELVQKEKVVGIGECGLDYYHMKQSGIEPEEMLRLIELQKDLFERQILLALREGLPLSLHVRDTTDDAYLDTLEVLSDYYSARGDSRRISFSIDALSSRYEHDALDAQVVASTEAEGLRLPGVLHCISGSEEYIRTAIEMGFMVGICGNITFKNAQELREILKQIPLESMVLETDAPFLAPGNMRGKRNEPAFMVETAQCLADLKGISLVEVERATTDNAQRLFKI